jgi:hypothetical protein
MVSKLNIRIRANKVQIGYITQINIYSDLAILINKTSG